MPSCLPRHVRLERLAVVLLLGPLLLACGGGQTAPREGSDSSEARRFDDMKPGERKAYMKEVVMPRMSELFQSADATRYADMDCTTCHGAGARRGHFHMPAPDLPKLDVTDGFAAHKAESPELTRFMMQQVVPEMARLLGEHPYDPETGQGFGCFGCHEKK